METCRGSCCAWSWRRSGRVWVSAWRETGIVPASASSWWDSIRGGRPLKTDASGWETSCWRWDRFTWSLLCWSHHFTLHCIIIVSHYSMAHYITLNHVTYFTSLVCFVPSGAQRYIQSTSLFWILFFPLCTKLLFHYYNVIKKVIFSVKIKWTTTNISGVDSQQSRKLWYEELIYVSSCRTDCRSAGWSQREINVCIYKRDGQKKPWPELSLCLWTRWSRSSRLNSVWILYFGLMESVQTSQHLHDGLSL